MSILKKTGTFFQVDLSYLLRGGFVLGIGHVTGTLLGFCLSLIFANYVDVAVYGQYKYIVSIAGILGAFTLSGVGTTILQSVAKGYDGTLFAEQKSYLKWSLISVVLSFFVGGYYIFKGDMPLGAGVIVATLCSYVFNSLTLQNPFLSAKKDFKRLTINQILNAGALLIIVSGAIFFGLKSALWIIITYYGSQIFFQALTYIHMLRVYKPNASVDPEDKHLSKHLSLGNIIISIAEYIDKILIFQFFGPAQVALYAFSVGVPDQIRGVNKMLGTLVVPKLSIKDAAGLHTSIFAHTQKYLIVSSAITLAFYFVAPYFFAFFFPAYVEAAALASLYMLLLPITAMCTMHGYAIQIRRDVKSLYIIRFVDSMGKIILFIIFIPWLGVLGAILAILISKLITALLQIYLYHYNFK